LQAFEKAGADVLYGKRESETTPLSA
jgi:hypothetical protein